MIAMRSLAKPKRWIVLGVLVALAVPTFAVAGLWQLSRLDERREHNALVEARRELPVATLDEALGQPGEMEHRRVRMSGRYDPDHEFTLLGRGLDGRPGDHLLTPLLVGEEAVLVNRGWVPTGEPEGAGVPASDVAVTGYLLPTEGPALFGSSDGTAGATVSRVDVARIGAALPYPLATQAVYLLLESQDPTQALPEPAPLDELGEGSHLIYAVQWFLFIPTLLVVYGALLRSQRKKATAT
jgi:surfeit locus 1 family protein